MALRGYFYQRLPFRTSKFSELYYLNMKGKANYWLFDNQGLPLVNYNEERVLFPVTIANYYLGKIDSKKINNLDIDNILRYLNVYTNENGLVRHEFNEKNFGNRKIWYSHLAQSMFYSLLVRARLQGFEVPDDTIESLENTLFEKEIYREGIFVEYPAVDHQPQNGQMFGVFALLDLYALKKISKERLTFHIDETYRMALSLMHPLGWTYYSKSNVSSPFYHLLHLDMYKVLMSYDKRFYVLYTRGAFGFVFYPLFVIKKIIQKYVRL